MRQLGTTGLALSAIGFGAFKIGRNEKVKYAQGYVLPSDDEAERILHGVLDLGIRYIDTAPAYGVSEERIGRFLASRADACVMSTKVGEMFLKEESRYDFSADGVRRSVMRSRERLGRERLDLVFIHSSGEDERILRETDAPRTLRALREEGVIRAIGFSGKTVSGARMAMEWADAIMVEYHLHDRSHEDVMHKARQSGVGVVVKKALASGSLDAGEALRFALQHPAVTSVVVGSLSLQHLRVNVAVADALAADHGAAGSEP